MRFAEIHLDLHPYLIKYIQTDTEQSALRVDPHSELGSTILERLQYPPTKGWREPRIRKERRLTLLIPKHILATERRGQYLTEDDRLVIARCIEILFWQRVNQEVIFRGVRYGQKEAQVLRKIKDMYGISEEDFKEESMGRRYRRWKERHRIPVPKEID